MDKLTKDEWYETMCRESVHDVILRLEKGEYPIWINPILRHSGEQESLLEIGSGTGELSAILAKHGRNVGLLDYSPESIAYSKTIFKEMSLPGDFYVRDVLKDVSLSCVYDYVWSSGLLEHFSDSEIETILDFSYRHSERGVMSLVPNANSIFYRIGKHKMEEEGTWPYGYERSFFSMKPYYAKLGFTKIVEFSIGIKHSLNFWGKDRPEIRRFFSSLTKVEMLKLNQGYLLFTYGKK